MGAEEGTAHVLLWGSEQGKALVRVDYCWLIPIRAVLQGPQCHPSAPSAIVE